MNNLKMIQSSRKILQFIVIILILLFIIAGSFYLIMGGRDLGISKNRVEVIYVQGIMLTGSIPTGFGVATSEDMVNPKQVWNLRKRRNIILYCKIKRIKGHGW